MPGTLLHVPGQTWVAGPGHRWCDDEACVELRFPSGGASAVDLQRLLRVSVGPTSFKVELLTEPPQLLLDAPALHAEVQPHATSWSLDAGPPAELVLRLTKADALQPWTALQAGGPDADGGAAMAARAAVEALLRAAADGDEAALRTAAARLDEDGEGVQTVLAAVKDAHGRGALHFAALRGHAQLCAALCADLGMPVDARDEDGAHPTMRCIVMRTPDAPFRAGDTPLALAARGGCAEAAAALLAAGADARARCASDAQPLHHAAAAGCAPLVAALLSAGADAAAESPAGPPLLWAAGAAQLACCEALLAAGAPPGAASPDGVSALVALAALGPSDAAGACARALLSAGADARHVAPLADAFTALHVAAEAGALQVAQALLDAGADPDATDAHGGTPLQAAAASGDVDMTALLMRTAKPDARVTPWEPAAAIEAARAGVFAPAGAPAESTAPVVAAAAPAAPQPRAPAALPPPTPEAAARSAAAKRLGDTAFARSDFAAAVAAYSDALRDDPGSAVLFANRSVAALQCGDVDAAVADGERAVALRPDWPKACYRLGNALHAAGRFEDAAHAFFQGVQLGGEGGDDLARAFKRSIEAGRAQHQAHQAAQQG
jgi:ankyrin repeat protein